KMLTDDPINEFEEVINTVFENYGPYQTIDDIEESEEIGLVFSDKNIEAVIRDHIQNYKTIDYSRIKWLYKRFSQFGVENALPITLKYINDLMPAINSISQFFLSVANSCNTNLYKDGESLFALLADDFIKENKYIQISILSLFSHSSKFNCTDKLIKLYNNADDNVKREIILSLYRVGGTSWIREIKQDYATLNIWSKRALAIASSMLAKDERRFFINDINKSDNLSEKLILELVKNM
ncbi:MAG: hypothetical protein AAGU14_12355, partial [Eubacteriaceae bacterium]